MLQLKRLFWMKRDNRILRWRFGKRYFGVFLYRGAVCGSGLRFTKSPDGCVISILAGRMAIGIYLLSNFLAY